MWREAQSICFRPEAAHPPHAVLVFPSLGGSLVWVFHPDRGWEVPGGKVEGGETPEEAARREVFEEAGLVLDEMAWLGEYVIPTEDGVVQYKWVYVASVFDARAKPDDYETTDVRCFHPPLTPAMALLRPDISPIMRDMVFTTFWPLVREHPLYTSKPALVDR